MSSKNSKQQINLLQKRKEYGSDLFNNAISKHLDFPILSKELKQEDFEKIAKNVENGINLLNRKFLKIDKDYQKFINERKLKIKELKNKNEDLDRKINNLEKDNKRLIEKINTVSRTEQTINEDLKKVEQNWDEIKELNKQSELYNPFLNIYHKIQKKEKQKQEYENYYVYALNSIDEYALSKFNGNQGLKNAYTNSSKSYLFSKYIPEIRLLEREICNLKIEYSSLLKEFFPYDDTIEDIISDHVRDLQKKLSNNETRRQELLGEIYRIGKEKYGVALTPKKTAKNNKINQQKNYNFITKEQKNYDLILEAIKDKLTKAKKSTKNINHYSRLQQNIEKNIKNLKSQISKNQNQIDKLNHAIDVETQKYNNKEKAYNRVFDLYQNQQKIINNKGVYKDTSKSKIRVK